MYHFYCVLLLRNMKPKIFVIGFNKTATSTIHTLFQENGIPGYHQGKKYKTINWKTMLPKYNCFSDISFTLEDIEELHKTYQNAIFILNVRNIDKWLISRFKHGERNFHMSGSHPFYPCSFDKCNAWIKDRERKHLQFLDFFKDKPNKLLLVNIEKKGWIHFLRKEFSLARSVHNIHVNPTQNTPYHNEIINTVNDSLEKLDYNKNTLFIANEELLQSYLEIYNRKHV